MILSASGGLVYHARAAFTRFESLIRDSSEDRWAPTRRCVSMHVANWLEELTPETLIIFGPSAGYLLEPDFFSNLKRPNGISPLKIVAVDPDPLAAFLFRRRFSASSVDWHGREDLLPFSSPSASGFGDFLRAASRTQNKTAVLFLGLLGQVAFHTESATRSTFEARRLLMHELANFNWASLHDLESTTLERGLGTLPPEIGPDVLAEAAPTTTAARAEFSTVRLRQLRANPKAWVDHDTEWLGPPEVVIPWLLASRRFHHLGFRKTSIVVTG
jgi:hypothetical protein